MVPAATEDLVRIMVNEGKRCSSKITSFGAKALPSGFGVPNQSEPSSSPSPPSTAPAGESGLTGGVPVDCADIPMELLRWSLVFREPAKVGSVHCQTGFPRLA